MSVQPSPFRLNAMRMLFLLNALYVGAFVLRVLISHVGPWDPVRGVAYSFWGALSLLSAIGVRYPLQMLPVLLMQFVYKSIWLLAIYPALPTDGAAGLTPVMAGGALVLAVVIPWGYVFSAYVTGAPEGWRRRALGA